MPYHEVPGHTDPHNRYSRAPPDFYAHQRQRDRDPQAPLQHVLEVRIPRVVVIVPVSRQSNDPEKQIGNRIQLLQLVAVLGNSRPCRRRHVIQIGQHSVDVNVRSLGGRDQQRAQRQVEVPSDFIRRRRLYQFAQFKNGIVCVHYPAALCECLHTTIGFAPATILCR